MAAAAGNSSRLLPWKYMTSAGSTPAARATDRIVVRAYPCAANCARASARIVSPVRASPPRRPLAFAAAPGVLPDAPAWGASLDAPSWGAWPDAPDRAASPGAGPSVRRPLAFAPARTAPPGALLDFATTVILQSLNYALRTRRDDRPVPGRGLRPPDRHRPARRVAADDRRGAPRRLRPARAR